MCSDCSNLFDVMQTHYDAELRTDTNLLFQIGTIFRVHLKNWPTEVSAAPTMEELNNQIGG
tara:strand:+ start:362 stop:544 length:183 start_codon:yes stop_codon:yes gene_type:complete